jgi:glycerol-3-phosphate acyltransferase PlsY
MPAGVIVAAAFAAAYLIGSVPFSHVVSRVVSGVDLRDVGIGTVSGSGVGVTSGFWPMALAGLLDIGKGALAVLPLAGSRPMAAAVAGGFAVAGHNWSPFLRAAGGRGISVAIGACAVLAWPGALVLLAGMAVGKVFHQTALGSVVSQAALPPVLAVTDGRVGLVVGLAAVVPMWTKRVLGNRPPAERSFRVFFFRWLYDHDPGGEAGRP